MLKSKSASKSTHKSNDPWTLSSIGVVHTAFKEKFGIPRQPGLVAQAKGVVELFAHPFLKQSVRELETFSHLWILFVFHEHGSKDWKPSIRPPRLGGAKKVGVLASRSPHRPNPIGMSAVKIDSIDTSGKSVKIHVSGVDILDGSPVLDVKPYLPYADSIPQADPGWAKEEIVKTAVTFSPASLKAIEARLERYPDLKVMIVEMLELDPRPAFQKRRMPPDSESAQGKTFGFKLFEYDVKWEIHEQGFRVLDVEDLVDGKPKTKAKRL